ELGEAGHRALPHLGAGDADDDAVIRLDDDPGSQLRRTTRGANDLRTEREIHAKCEPAAERGRADDESAAVDLWNAIHVRLLTRSLRRGSPPGPAGMCRSGRCW